MLSRTIGEYHFLADKESGVTFRWGKSFEDNPTFAPIPELADISISNRCSKGCSFCYRSSTPGGAIMTVDEYCSVLDGMNDPVHGNVFQVALGGGEPLEHPEFYAIIEETNKRGIVPNFTTNGALLNENVFADLKGKIGAMAISVTDINDIAAFSGMLSCRESMKVNIHYILSRQSIIQAKEILDGKYNELLKNINAIVYLTYKPAGRGSARDVLLAGDSLTAFIESVKQPRTACKIGFDACFVPMLLTTNQALNMFVDFCEGGFFSVYINEKREVSPCSFSNGLDTYSLDEYGFYDIWLNKFQAYREKAKNHCATDCPMRSACRGACPYYPRITTCYT